MTTAALLALAVTAVAAVADWGAVASRTRLLEYVAKPLTLAALVAVAALLEPVDATQRGWFVVALLASLVGDVALMLPAAKRGATPHGAPTAFLVGLTAFLLGHVAYVVGFLVGGVTAVGLFTGALVAAGAGGSAGRAILRGARAHGDDRLVGALAAYLLVIGAMVVTAFGSGRPLAAAGATLFLVSDALIGWDRFVRPLARGPIVIIVTYHLGQALLVVSLLG